MRGDNIGTCRVSSDLPLDATAAAVAAAAQRARHDGCRVSGPLSGAAEAAGSARGSAPRAQGASSASDAGEHQRARSGTADSELLHAADPSCPADAAPTPAPGGHSAASDASLSSGSDREHASARGEAFAAVLKTVGAAQPTPVDTPRARRVAECAVLRTQPRGAQGSAVPMMAAPRGGLNTATATSALTDYLLAQAPQRSKVRRGVGVTGSTDSSRGARVSDAGGCSVVPRMPIAATAASVHALAASPTLVRQRAHAGPSAAPQAVAEGAQGVRLQCLRHPSSQHSSAQRSIPHVATWAQRRHDALLAPVSVRESGPFAPHELTPDQARRDTQSDASEASAPPWARSNHSCASEAPQARCSSGSDHGWDFAARRSDAAAHRLGKPTAASAPRPAQAPRVQRGPSQQGPENPWRAALLRLHAEARGDRPLAEAQSVSGSGGTSWRHDRATFSAVGLGAAAGARGPFVARQHEQAGARRVQEGPGAAATGQGWIRGEFTAVGAAATPPVVAAGRISGMGPVRRQRRWIARVAAPPRQAPAPLGNASATPGPIAESPLRGSRQRRQAAAAQVAPQPSMSLQQRLRLSFAIKARRASAAPALSATTEVSTASGDSCSERPRFSAALPSVPLTAAGARLCDAAAQQPAPLSLWALPTLAPEARGARALLPGARAGTDATTWHLQHDVLAVQASLQRLCDSGCAGEVVSTQGAAASAEDAGGPAFATAHVCAYVLEVRLESLNARHAARLEPERPLARP